MESPYFLTEDMLNWLRQSPSLGVFVTDKNLNIKSMNEWLRSRSQLTTQDFIDKHLFDVYPEIVSRKLYDHYNQAIQGQISVLSCQSIEYLIRLPSRFEDYKYMQQNILIAPLIDWDKISGTITIIDDVTCKYLSDIDEKNFLEGDLYSQDEWQLTFDSVPDLIAIIDKDYKLKRINRAMAKSLGIKAGDAVGRYCYQLFHRTKAPPSFCPHRALLSDGQPHSSDYYEETLKKYLKVTVIPCYDSSRNFLYSVHIVRDISEKLRMEQLLRNLSITDDLTGLYNRKGFMTLTEQLIGTSNRLSYRVLILFMNLNGMKFINEIFGHLEGDHALRGAATILRSTFRETDIIARYGGDEFIVSAMQTGKADSSNIIDRLNKKSDVFNAQTNKIYKLSFTTGVAVYDPNEPVSLEELIAQAKNCMYEAKFMARFKNEEA